MEAETFVIESYSRFTDELYREYYGSIEALEKGLYQMAYREDWNDIDAIIEKLLYEGEVYEGYEYIQILMY